MWVGESARECTGLLHGSGSVYGDAQEMYKGYCMEDMKGP